VQHEHPLPWDLSRGALALRSLTAAARTFADDTADSLGAVSSTRGAVALQAGQSDGNSHSAIGRRTVNGPQSPQRYS
jgi:hypothetical protein